MDKDPAPDEDMRPPVAISACLLGEPVRYDGGHKKDRTATGLLAGRVRWIPLCPEVEIDLGVPRPPIRLERRDGALRLRSVEGDADLTERMQTWSRTRLETLAQMDVCGFVLKARSPSCGIGTTPVHDEDGRELGDGSGLFAEAAATSCAHLPAIDEDGLADPERCRAFLDRVDELWRGRREGARP